MKQSMKKIAIIGAGTSGITAIKNCLDYGFVDVICFEKTNYIAGIWQYKSNLCDGEGSVMKSTILNTSKELSGYSDFPPPKEAANFMRNADVLDYIRTYCDHFDVLKYIRFEHAIVGIERADDYDQSGQCDSCEQSAIFDAVMICTGHHVYPYIPVVRGIESFNGRILHSHAYKCPDSFVDRRVLIVGLCNSGGDIACELGRHTKQVYASTRHGTWITQRVAWNGYPRDVILRTRFRRWFQSKILPKWLNLALIENDMNLRIDHDRYGIRPAERAGESPVLIADDFPLHLASGWVKPKVEIDRFDGSTVHFVDGTVEKDIDDVIFCTGYSFDFRIIENGKLLPVVDNQTRLYRRVFPPNLPHPTLAIIGLVDPLGPTVTVAEMQSRVVCHLLANGMQLPSRSVMEQYVDDEKLATARHYKCSARRASLQVDYIPYMDEMAAWISVRPTIDYRLWLNDPWFAIQLVFGPMCAYQYRLCDGTNESRLDARRTIMGIYYRVLYGMNYRLRRNGEQNEEYIYPPDFIRLIKAIGIFLLIIVLIIIVVF